MGPSQSSILIWVEDGVPVLRSMVYDAAVAGRRILNAGWPDARSVNGALVEPAAPELVTWLSEGIARAQPATSQTS